MKTLFEYFLESLIEKSHLDKEMKFIESTADENADLIFSDDYENGKLLDLKDKEEFEDAFKADYCIHYQIKYKDNILGVFGVSFFRDINKKIDNIAVWILIHQLLYLIDKDKMFSNIKDDELIDKTVYVEYLQINQYIKQDLDINHLAIIKAFFEKFIKLCKEKNIEYITANGKNEKVTNLYVKIGNFTCFKKAYDNDIRNKFLYKITGSKGNADIEKQLNTQLDSFVVKKI